MTAAIDPSPIHLLPTPPGCPIAVAAAHVPNLQPGDATRRFAAGWGATAEAAVASCRNEIAERVSAQINGDERIIVGPAARLAGEAVLPPELLLIDDGQYASGQPEEAAEWPRQPWRQDQAIGWIAADPAFSMRPAWVPAGLCFLGHADDRGAGLLPADTNGLAAGMTREDAAIRGFLELVERDAVAVWWYNRLTRPAIDAAVLGDPLIAAYAGWMATQGRELRLIDLTHDLGIPVIAAISHDPEGGHIALGFGAGLDAAAAARHALGEMTQVICNIALIGQRVAAQSGAGQGDASLAPEVRRLWHWWREAKIADHPHLDPALPGELPGAIGALDLGACHDICRRHGLTFFAVDLTRDAIGVPAMRVIVPGLRPMAPRFAPGRLYDVPIDLGWLPRPLLRQDLNPVPMLF
ncbi:MAG TPA: YcaO-like family protein [Dongiaceae bacterium]|nr:YcaO-like family protein [Dongiaceae bacterium]